jgi:hypothetical protein
MKISQSMEYGRDSVMKYKMLGALIKYLGSKIVTDGNVKK